MKLRTKFALVLLLITLVLSGGIYGGLELYKDRLVEEERADVNETASLTASQLDTTVEDRKDFVGFSASRPAAARFEESDRFLSEFVGNSRFFAAQIVDANGTVVDFHGDITQDVREESIGENVSGRPYVDRPLEGATFVSDPEYANSTRSHLVVFSAPIFEGQQLKGLLAASIYLDTQTFFGVLAPISRDDQRVTVRAGATTLYRSGEEFPQSIEQSATVDSTGWVVTIDRDRSGLIAQLSELAIAQGVGLLIVMFSVVAFGVWEYRTTLAQTEELLEGFTALQEGDFEHELSLMSAEEWEQIGVGFNALARSLRDREQQLREREQRIQVLNRVLRHNLRNLAGIVIGYAEIVRSRASDGRVDDAAESIYEAGRDLEELSRKAGQLEYTMGAYDPIAVDVPTIVADVVEDLDSAYPGVEITTSLPREAWALAEPSIRLAIENLCENACQHAGVQNPRLDVRVAVEDEDVTVAVADNGEGIPEHERSVLDAGEETPLEHSSGLGLWIAQWAVERSAGSLVFETNDEGGSTVTVTLQAATPETEPGAEGGGLTDPPVDRD